MIFTGQTELTVDAKGRLAVPARYRSRWDPAQHGTGWMCIPWPEDGGMLRLFPERQFELLGDVGESSLTPTGAVGELESQLFGLAELIEMDSAGRVRLPARHMALVGLPSEVVVIGVRNRLEVRSRAAWQAKQEAAFASLPELAAKLEAERRASTTLRITRDD